jgi:hypothetical protein
MSVLHNLFARKKTKRSDAQEEAAKSEIVSAVVGEIKGMFIPKPLSLTRSSFPFFASLRWL